MKIKKIKLVNFRQFQNAEIEFSDDPQKPFTIVTGNNTSGKTTIVKAIVWCLYGDNQFSDPILLNKDIADNMYDGEKARVEVRIVLEHDNFTYKIGSMETYVMKDGKVKSFEKPSISITKVSFDGVTSLVKNDENARAEINSILSEDLSPYFLFYGESNIDKITKKQSLTNAVSELMGLKQIEKMASYFTGSSDNVIKRFQDELETDDPLESSELKDKIEEAQNSIESKLAEIDTINENIDNLNALKDEKELLLEENSSVADDQAKKKTITKEIARIVEKKENDFSTLQNLLCNHSILLKNLFAYSFKNNDFKSSLNKSDFLTDKSLSHISEEAIDELISRGYCLCGAEIKNENDAYKHLIDQKNYIEPRNYGKQIQNFIENEEDELNYLVNNMNNLENTAVDISDSYRDLDENNDKLAKVISDLEGKPDVGSIQTDINRINYQLGLKDSELNNIKNSIPLLEDRIQLLNDKLSKISKNTLKNDFTNKCIEYATKILNLINNKITTESQKIREDLERIVGDIFNQIYTGNMKIEIDDKYRVSTSLTDGTKLDSTPGLDTVKNFSFVAGIMKMLKDKKQESTDDFDDENKESDLPLIMDAPFSNTDEKHIANICSTLPKYCNQIFFAVMNKDFKNAEPLIKDKVDKHYIIVKESESLAHLELKEN